MKLRVKVKRHGPVFDGRARAAVRAGLGAAVWAVTKQGRMDLGLRFIRVFKHPTGYYESRVEAQRVSQFRGRVHDNLVVYGPWLEGTGSRNYPVTRFRGYHSFRLVTQGLQIKAGPIAQREIDAHLQAVK